MPAAARITDETTHGGSILGPGNPTVLIGGLPAATIEDTHLCALPDSDDHPMTSSFISASSTVLIGGKPALRAGDESLCGAKIIQGFPTVLIG